MGAHNHREFVEGCFRCDLHLEEVREYEGSTPDTREVREMFTDETMNPEIEGKRFDRWHAEELRKARAEAWEEGYTMGTEGVFDADNPYRADQNEVNNNG